jgi:hypothetical protein
MSPNPFLPLTVLGRADRIALKGFWQLASRMGTAMLPSRAVAGLSPPLDRLALAALAGARKKVVKSHCAAIA